MAHCWDEYLWKVHKAVPVDPWATNLQLLDVFIHERSSSSWLPAWLQKEKTKKARVGSMLTVGIKGSPAHQVLANTVKGTAFSQFINKNGTSAGLKASENNVNGRVINSSPQPPPKIDSANSDTTHLAQPGNNGIDGGASAHLQRTLQNADSNLTSQPPLPSSSIGVPAHPQHIPANSDSGGVSIDRSLPIKANSMPDIQASIKTSTSLLASLTGGSSLTAQFDVKGSNYVSCNIGGVTSQQVDIDTLMELVTLDTSPWRPDFSIPKLQWSFKRGQTLWVVVEIMYANQIKIEVDNQVQANAKASQGNAIKDSNQAGREKDVLWSVKASEANPIFPFALRLLKLDYDACGNLVNAENKKLLHRNSSLNSSIKRLSSKRVNGLHHSLSVSHVLP